MKQKSLSVSGGCHYHCKNCPETTITSFEVLQAYKMHVLSMCLGCTKLDDEQNHVTLLVPEWALKP